MVPPIIVAPPLDSAASEGTLVVNPAEGQSGGSGSGQVFVDVNTPTINLVDGSGAPLGYINFPEIFMGNNISISVTSLNGFQESGVTLNNVNSPYILDVSFTDRSFNFEDVEICLESSNSDAKKECLAFITPDKKWECVDECLKKKNGLKCGRTNHFTQFALLLGVGSDKACDNTDEDRVIPFLSLAFICVALLIIILSFIYIEINVRRKTRLIIKDSTVECEYAVVQ